MTQHQIFLVQRTWRLVRNIKPEILGDVFYSKLFADEPAIRRLFKSPLDHQYKKIIDMINAIVGRLEKLGEMDQEIKDLARRHVAYKVRPAHYRSVGSALLWTLEQALGPDWTPEVNDAWTRCYQILAGTMMTASGY